MQKRKKNWDAACNYLKKKIITELNEKIWISKYYLKVLEEVIEREEWNQR